MKRIFLLLFFLSKFYLSMGQCPYNNVLDTTVSAPTIVGSSVVVNTMMGGDMMKINGMQANHIYKISTCTGNTFDTELTLYSSSGGQVLGYNDDACGSNGSEIIFCPLVSGSYDLLLDKVLLGIHCLSSSTPTSVVITLINLPQAVINIPVVFHLVNHSINDSVSDNQVFEQLSVLNNAFQRDPSLFQNGPLHFQGISGAPFYKFCLAQRDPQGNITKGIVRVHTNNLAFNNPDDVKFSNSGGSDIWDRNSYLNIWVCNLSGVLLGQATFPSTLFNNTTPSNDGVVIDYVAFGTSGTAQSPFNLGFTTVHEVGHWFNLYHIWGDDPDLPILRCSFSDHVDDTPNQARKTTNCPSGILTDECSSSSPGIMYDNFMDYTEDACLNMFSVGQTDRMNEVIRNPNGTRHSLLASNGCTPPPINCPSGGICFNNNSNETLCTGTLYDDGGNSNYANNRNFTKKFTPSSAGKKLQLSFSAFLTQQASDVLTIYDGPTTAFPQIGVYSGNLAPFTILATNPTGELTLKWQTNGNTNYSGWQTTVTCVNPSDFTIPPGSYKSVYLSGLNLNSQTNELEFLLQGVTAQPGDIPVNIADESSKIKKRFKQALAIPEGNQWISLNINQSMVGDATTGSNFENTDLAKDFLVADVNLKFSSVFKPITGFSPYTGTFTDWNNLLSQGPYFPQIQALPNLYYPFWGVYAGIHSKNLNYSSQGYTKIIVNTAEMEMHQGILWTELDNSVNNLSPSYLRNTLLNKITPYRTQLLQRLSTGVNNTTPLVNTNGPQFQQLRNSYRITAAAHWYKTLTNNTSKPYQNLINSNNLTGIMVDPPYDDNYWNGQALQPLPHLFETYHNYNNQGNGNYSCVGGVSFGNYNLIDSGAFNNTLVGIDTVCFKNKGYVTIDSSVYFYGGILDQVLPDLNPVLFHPNNNQIVLGDTISISAIIYNFGNLRAQNFPVRLYEQYINAQNQLQNILIGQQTVALLDSFGSHNVNFTWVPVGYGNKKIFLTVDEGNSIIERRENNNSAIDSVVVLNNLPIVQIVAPAEGSSMSNRKITLIGSTFDFHDGYLPYSNISWSSNIDGLLGHGSYLIMDSLSVGNHVITFTGTNAHGQTAFDYINIYIFPQGYPSVSISSPLNNDTLPDNAPILFSGNAFDLTNGNLCYSALWSSNQSGNLGVGCNLNSMLSIGTHTITFIAQNTSGHTATATRNIHIISGKPHISTTFPVANTSFYQHQNVLFSATATDFPQGNISTGIQWYSNLQGFLGNGQSFSRLLIPGNHTITAVVQDNAGSIDTAIITPIHIRFTPPVPSIVQPLTNSNFLFHDTVRLIGHATDLQDGALHGNHLKWYSNLQGFLGFGDTLAIATLNYGYHTITLKATDSDNTDSSVVVSNIFIDAGQPTCSIILPTNGATYFFGSPITFKGTSIDPQNGILTGSHLQWYSNLNGNFGSGDSLIINTLSAGSHIISFAATDFDGFSTTSTKNIVVQAPHAPVVSIYFPATNTHFLHGTTVTLKASATDYEEGVLNNNRFIWSSSINGNLGTGKNISLSNLSPGTHIISATCNDTTGLITTATIQIVIDQCKPVTQINSPVSGAVFSLGTNITFTGIATDYEDGALTGNSLQWSTEANVNLGSGNTVITSALTTGSHLIKLIATDSQNSKDTADVLVIIQAPHTVLLKKFSSGADSISHLFPPNGGDTILYVFIPKTATVLNAQARISGRSDLIATVAITANPPGTVTCGSTITFTATFTNGGSSPSFQWQKNGINVGTNSPTFSSNSWQNGDRVKVIMTSNLNNVSEPFVISNVILIICN